ncbi:MAG: hypothetical protein M1828_001448 [Chrysothrix sp. TS-e1954]|nr:MAG: hypothetical protein M1828_001448 [Chrysothrix sp. TS-e1954]
MLEKSCERFQIYGNTFALKELHRRAIITIEPDNIRTILSSKFKAYGISHRHEAFKPLLGQGIFDTDGDQWASSRALLRPSFTRDRIADLTSFEQLIKDLFALLPGGEKTVDLQELFFRYTIDSSTAFLFGESVGTLKNSLPGSDFAKAFQNAQQAILIRGMLGPLKIFYRNRKADKCNRICRTFAQHFVEETYQADKVVEDNAGERSIEKESHKHIFSHQLASRTPEQHRVLDELMNVLLAGRDTTASLLSNLFFMLAKHPPIWDRLRFVPRNERQALKDTVLPRGGGEDGLSPILVPGGTLICFNLYAMHRRKDFFGTDAEEFRPERWEDGTLQPRWGYLPFNGGPRICIGQRYALTEVGYVVVRMVQEFRSLESRDSGPWEESLTLTLCSRNGTKVCLTQA